MENGKTRRGPPGENSKKKKNDPSTTNRTSGEPRRRSVPTPTPRITHDTHTYAHIFTRILRGACTVHPSLTAGRQYLAVFHGAGGGRKLCSCAVKSSSSSGPETSAPTSKTRTLRFGQSGAEQASAAPEAARVASRCGQPRPTGPGYTVVRLNRPLRPCFRHSLRTKLAHKRLDPVACDQPLLLRDDVGEDLLAALAHLV